MDTSPLKPTWASATFLQYLGTLFVLGALETLFTDLQDAHGSGGLAVWSTLAVAVALALAVLAEMRGEPIVAGLVALVAVFAWAVLAGSVLDLVGFDIVSNGDAASTSVFNSGLALGMILLEALVIAAALLALLFFRFPLLTLIVAAVTWYAVMDLLEGALGGGDTATAILAIVVGLAFVAAGVAIDRSGSSAYAFWAHVVGGLSVGGGIVWLWHEHSWQWLLVLVVSLVYLAASRVLRRSSYAVIGAIGLAGTATYFIEKWFSLGSLIPFLPSESSEVDKWGRPLVYLGLGAVFVLLGILIGLERRMAPAPAETAPAPPA